VQACGQRASAVFAGRVATHVARGATSVRRAPHGRSRVAPGSGNVGTMPDEPRGFDEVQTQVQAPPPNYATKALRHHAQVQWTDRRGAQSAELDGRLVVGSAADSGIVVDDPAVSRIHAELELRDDGLWVRDLGSRNGTFIEGILVSLGRVPEGGTVRVGSTVLAIRRESTPKPVELWPLDQFGPMLGRSAAMRELFARLARIARTESTVLIQGETGTGKELVAQAIHNDSPRAKHPFVVVDCAALPENLLESELFGHAKGAFTGAVSARAGAIESADTGTVFLDEVGELPLSLQPKLLRVLESRTIRRIGENAHRKVDVRFLSATNRDVRTMVNEGTFREDLYFRLAVIPVLIPPLRERTEDLTMLMESFAPAGTVLVPELLDEATKRPWRGNVRELRNFVERVVALGSHEALSMPVPEAVSSDPGTGDLPWKVLQSALDRPLQETRTIWLDALERTYVHRLLERHGGNVARAAEAADVDRTHLYRLIRKHDR
jgi:two-component system response regulator GlrR